MINFLDKDTTTIAEKVLPYGGASILHLIMVEEPDVDLLDFMGVHLVGRQQVEPDNFLVVFSTIGKDNPSESYWSFIYSAVEGGHSFKLVEDGSDVFNELQPF